MVAISAKTLSRKCVNCTKPVSADYFPFCSERCKNIDLYKWMSEQYVIKDTKIDEAE